MGNQSQPESANSCSMVGLLGILIQIGLGILSFSVLIIKRFTEKQKRPWRIWILDTSKQIISQMMAHFINLTISIALTYDDEGSDQCLWYFITNIFDNTIGVFISCCTLLLIEKRLVINNQESYISGNYYTKLKGDVIIDVRQIPPQMQLVKEQSTLPSKTIKKQMEQLVEEQEQNRDQQDVDSKVNAFELEVHPQVKTQTEIQQYLINYKAWIIQLLIWISIVVLAKVILFGIEFGLENPLQSFSFFILGWIQAYPVLQLVVVIVIVPVIMNGFAYWVQDNFLMKKDDANEKLFVLSGKSNKGGEKMKNQIHLQGL